MELVPCRWRCHPQGMRCHLLIWWVWRWCDHMLWPTKSTDLFWTPMGEILDWPVRVRSQPSQYWIFEADDLMKVSKVIVLFMQNGHIWNGRFIRHIYHCGDMHMRAAFQSRDNIFMIQLNSLMYNNVYRTNWWNIYMFPYQYLLYMSGDRPISAIKISSPTYVRL